MDEIRIRFAADKSLTTTFYSVDKLLEILKKERISAHWFGQGKIDLVCGYGEKCYIFKVVGMGQNIDEKAREEIASWGHGAIEITDSVESILRTILPAYVFWGY